MRQSSATPDLSTGQSRKRRLWIVVRASEIADDRQLLLGCAFYSRLGKECLQCAWVLSLFTEFSERPNDVAAKHIGALRLGIVRHQQTTRAQASCLEAAQR